MKHAQAHDEVLVCSFSLNQAIADGVLVELFKPRWPALTQGKPLVATAAVMAQISAAGLLEIWNAYVVWQQETMPTLPEADRLFTTPMNGETVWVIEDGAAFTILYPDDY